MRRTVFDNAGGEIITHLRIFKPFTAGKGTCTVPGLETDLSQSVRFTKVASVKSLGQRK